METTGNMADMTYDYNDRGTMIDLSKGGISMHMATPPYVLYAAAALTGILANPETADDIDIVCHTAHQFAEAMVKQPGKSERAKADSPELDTGAMHSILSTTQSNANHGVAE